MAYFASVLGDFLVGSVVVLFYFGVIVAWFLGMFDIFARRDITGWMKAAWLLLILILPLIGVALYFLFRPQTATYAHSDIFEDDPAQANHANMVALEVDRLAQMRDQGALTQEEFEQMKERVIAA